MHSSKHKKLAQEKRKARRAKHNSTWISHANKKYMDEILKGKDAYATNIKTATLQKRDVVHR